MIVKVETTKMCPKDPIWLQVRPNEQISVFQVTCLKILGTHIFFLYFFSGKIVILSILKCFLHFKMHKIVFFQENLKNILGFTGKFR